MNERNVRKVTDQAMTRRAKKFAAEADKAFERLCSLAASIEKRLRRKYVAGGERDRLIDEIGKVVDTYSDLNCRITAWCARNHVSERRFACEVRNACRPGGVEGERHG